MTDPYLASISKYPSMQSHLQPQDTSFAEQTKIPGLGNRPLMSHSDDQNQIHGQAQRHAVGSQQITHTHTHAPSHAAYPQAFPVSHGNPYMQHQHLHQPHQQQQQQQIQHPHTHLHLSNPYSMKHEQSHHAPPQSHSNLQSPNVNVDAVNPNINPNIDMNLQSQPSQDECDVQNSALGSGTDLTPLKKKRGRPRKEIDPNIPPPPPKKRGRPLGSTKKNMFDASYKMTIDKGRRFSQIIRVRPEYLEQYKALHKSIPPGVERTIRACGIRDYSIFFDGVDRLCAFFKYIGTDWDADMEKMKKDSETQEWWRMTDMMQMSYNDSMGSTDPRGNWWQPCEEIFRQE